MVDPDVILLGGGVSRSADLLIEPILARLRKVIPILPHVKEFASGLPRLGNGSHHPATAGYLELLLAAQIFLIPPHVADSLSRILEEFQRTLKGV